MEEPEAGDLGGPGWELVEAVDGSADAGDGDDFFGNGGKRCGVGLFHRIRSRHSCKGGDRRGGLYIDLKLRPFVVSLSCMVR